MEQCDCKLSRAQVSAEPGERMRRERHHLQIQSEVSEGNDWYYLLVFSETTTLFYFLLLKS